MQQLHAQHIMRYFSDQPEQNVPDHRVTFLSGVDYQIPKRSAVSAQRKTMRFVQPDFMVEDSPKTQDKKAQGQQACKKKRVFMECHVF
jgi:hypothetical protein